MRFVPKILINKFLISGNPEIEDKFSSRLQFDFLYDRIHGFQDISQAASKKELRLTALTFSTYLSHWGMFRGSSNLKDTNTLFFEHLITKLIGKKGILLPISEYSFNDFENQHRADVKLVIEDIKNLLYKNGVSPTSTLISKMIMGILGNIPAYDTEFTKGLKKLKEYNKFQGSVTFGVNSIQTLAQFSKKYTWPSKMTIANNDVPMGKLVDMAIFQYGKK